MISRIVFRSLSGMNTEPSPGRPSNHEWPFPVKSYQRMCETSVGTQGPEGCHDVGAPQSQSFFPIKTGYYSLVADRYWRFAAFERLS